MRHLAGFLFAILLALAPAQGQVVPEPAIEPVPSWIQQLAIPEPNPALRDRPAQTLLLSSQSLYGAELARGVLNLRLGRWPEAIADFATALADQPHMAMALYGRGLAHLGNGDRARGEADMIAARRLAFEVEWDFQRLGIAIPGADAAAAALPVN